MNTITCPHCFNELELEVTEIEEVSEPQADPDLICEHCHEEYPSKSAARRCCDTWYKRWLNSGTDMHYQSWKAFKKEVKR